MTEKSIIVPVDETTETTVSLPFFEETMSDLAGQLAPKSRETYMYDARHFATWLRDRGLDLARAQRRDIIEYRRHLAETYAKSTAARMLIVARRLLAEAVLRGDLATNPAADVRGFKSGDNETPHTALNRAQAREMLSEIDRSTPDGQRDYALIMLLLRTGLRRSEASALDIGDIKREQGYQVITVRHGKGDKRRKAKLPVDVHRSITDYLAATGRSKAGAAAPLFIRFRSGPGGQPHPTEQRLGEKGIEGVVKARAAAIGVDLTPHGLRASFVTLALEGGASLHQVQYAAGHADPRTTERYQKRKVNLDDNAVDYLKI
jgi:site-specific recombinase XerD